MELQKGAPKDLQNRAEVEKKVYAYLDYLGVEYDRVDHEAAFTMEVCAEIDKSLGARICKNLFLTNRQKTQFYLLMMPGDKVFKTKELSKQLGVSRLSFASGEAMEKMLLTSPGSASVLGLINDTEQKVQLVVDKDVLSGEFVGCHPCVNTSSIRLKTKDLFEKILPDLGRAYYIVELFGEE